MVIGSTTTTFKNEHCVEKLTIKLDKSVVAYLFQASREILFQQLCHIVNTASSSGTDTTNTQAANKHRLVKQIIIDGKLIFRWGWTLLCVELGQHYMHIIIAILCHADNLGFAISHNNLSLRFGPCSCHNAIWANHLGIYLSLCLPLAFIW